MAEVEDILARLEEETIDIDDLASEVRRAVELIKSCREKLSRTDREVRELVAELAEDEESAEPVADAPEAEPDADTPGPEAATGGADAENVPF
jgi:exodeoxyribonuclease VII small subunit